MKRIVVLAALALVVAGCTTVTVRDPSPAALGNQSPAAPLPELPEAATPRPVRATPRPVQQPQGARPGVTIWGGTAHLEVARSRSCNDLQSWFDAADAQRSALLDRYGPDDPDYEYAFEVMLQADERMRAIGCYD